MPQGFDEEGEVDWLEQTFGGGTNSLLSNTASGNILTDYARGVETEEGLRDVVANNGRFPNRLSARLINDVRANIDSGDLVARLPQERAGEGIPPLSEWRGYFALAQQEGT